MSFRVATSPRFLESDSSPSPACLESSPSPSLTGQDSSPSPAGFESESESESESRCLLLVSESESQGREFLSSIVQVIFRNTMNNITVILISLHDVSLC